MNNRYIFKQRWYRELHNENDLNAFILNYKETNLWIGIENRNIDLDVIKDDSYKYIVNLRKELDEYINSDSKFIDSLIPYDTDEICKPLIVEMMINKSRLANVGPMASVAGAFSHLLGDYINRKYGIDNIIIENGGDIYIRSTKFRKIGIYAGDSVFSSNIGIEIIPDTKPIGICTSSGTVGDSLSFGKADSVTIISYDTMISDSFATAFCNKVQDENDIEKVCNMIEEYNYIIGVIIILGNKIGIKGDIKLIKL